MTEEKYYTIEEVAEMLKVVYLTVYRWIQDGKLKAYKAGKQYRINKTDLDRFITSYERQK
jgi:putative molybdopterin biosynthesis protein